MMYKFDLGIYLNYFRKYTFENFLKIIEKNIDKGWEIMKYTRDYFDQYLERRNTRSIKWDGCNEKFGVDPDKEMIPMWIADMDFRAPQEVVEALMEKVKEEAYGYSTKPDSFFTAITNWVKKRYYWDAKKEWVVFTPGVIPGYTIAIQYMTKPGEGVIVQTPVYYPFMDSVVNNDRKLVKNQLVDNDGFYTIDFDLLEEQVKDPNNKMIILSNPHNPVGRCWTKEELEKLGNLCAENGVIVISDEIHADLMMGGHEHTALAGISEKIKDNTITFYAPSKTFNLAGLQTSYAIISNDEIRSVFEKGLNANRVYNMNWFGPVALETAYNECEDYVEELCDYIDKNIDHFQSYIEKNLPQLKMKKPEATYMIWVDFRDTGMTTAEIEHFISHKALIGVDYGTWFGEGGDGYLRFNLACPRSTVDKALAQLSKAFEELN